MFTLAIIILDKESTNDLPTGLFAPNYVNCTCVALVPPARSLAFANALAGFAVGLEPHDFHGLVVVK